MAGDASAYAVLGLRPGANSATIEQAYKRLIKEYHPDRSGGNVERAAEITRAYRELRAECGLKEPLELFDDDLPPGTRSRRWIAVGLVVAISVAALMVIGGKLPLFSESFAVGDPRPSSIRPGKGSTTDPIDQPLHFAEIDGSARSALQIARTRDEMALSKASSDCHRQLRARPSIAQLDRCAAFDDAVVEIENRDPLRDQGPFSELAVTGRIWSGATALSEDSVAIDGRLDRIRLRVEMVLAPFVDPASPAVPGKAN